MELLRIYPKTDSTNSEAARLIAGGEVPHGTAILALSQTQGRGQYGREWHSTPGQHMALSIILRPHSLMVTALPSLSMKASLAVIRSVRQFAPSSSPLIKWPNDIYAGDKKLAGLLIENSLSAFHVQHSIIGIGMNINERSFPEYLPNATSLFQLTGNEFDVKEVAEVVLNEVLKIMQTQGDLWKQEYDQFIYGLNENKNFHIHGSTVEAIIKDVDINGKIILQMNGHLRNFQSHEIKWLG